MEQRFGTPFLHVADMQEWHGIEGISDLYRQIGKMLGCENAVERVLQEEYERVADRYQELRAEFAKYKFCLIAHGIAYLPDALRVYQQDYGLPITKICIIMNPSYQAETGLDDAMMQRFKDRIELAKAEYGCDAEIYWSLRKRLCVKLRRAVICYLQWSSTLCFFKCSGAL